MTVGLALPGGPAKRGEDLLAPVARVAKQRDVLQAWALAPVLDVRPEELASLVAGGDWATTGTSSYASAPDMMVGSLSMSETPSYNKGKVLLSLERRLRDVPPLERIALLNEMIAAAVEELGQK